MISSCAHLALTWLVGITFAGLIMCSAISFPVDHFISIKTIFWSCLSFDLKGFERQQLYKICPHMELFITCIFVYGPIYFSSNSCCSMVHVNIDVSMYGSFRPPLLLMISVSTSQCLPSVYEAWSYLGATTRSLPFDPQQITTMNILFGNSGMILLALLLVCSPKSVAGRLFPCLPFFLALRILIAHFFKAIWTHFRQLHWALSKLCNGSQPPYVSKESATAVFQCRGPSQSCFNWLCPRIMDRCFFSQNPVTHTFFHLLNALYLAYPILLANFFKENSVCIRLTGGLPSTPPKSDKLSLTSSAPQLSQEFSGNAAKSGTPATSVFCSSSGR